MFCWWPDWSTCHNLDEVARWYQFFLLFVTVPCRNIPPEGRGWQQSQQAAKSACVALAGLSLDQPTHRPLDVHRERTSCQAATKLKMPDIWHGCDVDRDASRWMQMVEEGALGRSWRYRGNGGAKSARWRSSRPGPATVAVVLYRTSAQRTKICQNG